MNAAERLLPEWWINTTVSELVDVVRGVTYQKDDARALPEVGLLPILRANNIQNGRLDFSDLVYVPESCVSDKQLIQPGDIIVAMSSGSKSIVGKAAMSATPWNGAFGAFCGVLRPTAFLDYRYVSWFTHSSDYRRAVSELSAGVNINNLRPGHFEEIAIPLAPLSEQKVIADKLDALLAQVDTLRAHLDAIPAILKRFRQSVLSAAVTGKLTEDWRKGRDFESELVKFEDIVISSATGLVRSTEEQVKIAEGRYPYLKMNNIHEFWGIDLSNLVYVDFEGDACLHLLRAGDWLFNTRNSVELVGKSCVWGDGDFLYNNNILRVRFNEKASAKYIETWFRSGYGRNALTAVKSATTSVAAIYQRALMGIELPLPSPSEQTEIVRRVESLFAFADQIELRAKEATTRVKHLTQSILAKAFRGELTEEWRKAHPALVNGENSAKALLERIRATRANAATSPPRARKPGAHTVTSAPTTTPSHQLAAEAPKRRGRPRKT